ncbi:hypothetical protein ACHAW6_007872 [Cyclotella cf. meneghiniana]
MGDRYGTPRNVMAFADDMSALLAVQPLIIDIHQATKYAPLKRTKRRSSSNARHGDIQSGDATTRCEMSRLKRRGSPNCLSGTRKNPQTFRRLVTSKWDSKRSPPGGPETQLHRNAPKHTNTSIMRIPCPRLVPLLLSVWTLPTTTSSLSSPDSCLSNDTFELRLEGRCTYDELRHAVANKLAELATPCAHGDPDFELVSLFHPDQNETEARWTVEELCANAVMEKLGTRESFDFDRFSGMDHEFNKAFFDGQSSWNDGGAKLRGRTKEEADDGGASPEFHGSSKTVVSVKEKHAASRRMTWPDDYENFEQCHLNAAMCCWVDHDPNQDARFHKNTEVCYVDNTRAPSSNHVNAGVSLYGGINGYEAAFCHGFAWEDGSLDDAFKGNLLFLSEIYENMHNRGLSNNVPGAPMCGCIEKMPVVTRADCSMLEYNGRFVFKHSPHTNSITARGKVTIDTVECNGITIDGSHSRADHFGWGGEDGNTYRKPDTVAHF